MIPERYRAKCTFGPHPNDELDIRRAGVHQFVSGWVKNREGGGGHGISLPCRENRWACEDCIIKKSGGTFGQTRFFSL